MASNFCCQAVEGTEPFLLGVLLFNGQQPNLQGKFYHLSMVGATTIDKW